MRLVHSARCVWFQDDTYAAPTYHPARQAMHTLIIGGQVRLRIYDKPKRYDGRGNTRIMRERMP